MSDGSCLCKCHPMGCPTESTLRAEVAAMREHDCHAEELQAEVEELRRWKGAHKDQQGQIVDLEAEVERLKKALGNEEEWKDYFDLRARVAALETALREIAEARGTLIKTDVDSAAVTLLIRIAAAALEARR